ncbi:hypothetical protein [Janibacter melonis]|uniref:hypothetical protein n=1 Tax=Janibacter melonis TaxID=262209 RepID=UPI001748A241|nr:hypothetical protein [Janibacter melonis]
MYPTVEHAAAGYRKFGMDPERVRALCNCGYETSPYPTTAEADEAREAEHGVR